MTHYVIENSRGRPLRVEASEEQAKFYADPTETVGCTHTYRPIPDAEAEKLMKRFCAEGRPNLGLIIRKNNRR